MTQNNSLIRKQNRFYLTVGILLTLSEIWKQYTLTYVLNDGVYQWSYIPFQLCSLPMYLCIVTGLTGWFIDARSLKCAKADKTGSVRLSDTEKGKDSLECSKGKAAVRAITAIRRACITFLADYSLMSGIITFLDTSGLHYGYAPLTVHSYLWHIIIAGIGIYSGLILTNYRCRGNSVKSNDSQVSRSAKAAFGRPNTKPNQTDNKISGGCESLTLRDFIPATCIFLIGCVIAEIINLSFDRYGIVNMFYINPHYYESQIVFNDLAHIMPNNAVIGLYILCVMLAALIVHVLWMAYGRTRTDG